LTEDAALNLDVSIRAVGAVSRKPRCMRPGHHKKIAGVVGSHEEAIARRELIQLEFITNPLFGTVQKGHDIGTIGLMHD
jgi:hypothetical protein